MITPGYALTSTERVLPRMALDFTTAALDSRVTVTRALNTATRFNSSGYIETVNANLPRFDYDTATLACKGLLIEETRANLALNSNLSASWPATRASLVASSTLSPDGVNNALKLQEDTSNNSHFCNQTATVTNGASYTFSIFAKKGERNYLSVFCINTAAAANTFFNIDNGTIVSTSAGATAAIQNVGNGWYRCSVTTTTTSTTSGMYPGISADGITASYLGNGTSGIYLWGGQFELGAFVTSYIPTTTTSLTRNADAVSMTGTNFSSWYNATEGTFVARFLSTTGAASNNPRIFAFSDGTTGNRLRSYLGASNTTTTVSSGGSVVATLSNSLTQAYGTFNQIAIGYKLDNFGSATNGNALSPDTLGAVPVAPIRLNIGADYDNASLSQLNGYISKLSFYNLRLTNNEIIAFSKQG